jgi:hypothetical protein
MCQFFKGVLVIFSNGSFFPVRLRAALAATPRNQRAGAVARLLRALVNELIRERSPQGEKGESGERMCKARKGRNERKKGREFR